MQARKISGRKIPIRHDQFSKFLTFTFLTVWRIFWASRDYIYLHCSFLISFILLSCTSLSSLSITNCCHLDAPSTWFSRAVPTCTCLAAAWWKLIPTSFASAYLLCSIRLLLTTELLLLILFLHYQEKASSSPEGCQFFHTVNVKCLHAKGLKRKFWIVNGFSFNTF